MLRHLMLVTLDNTEDPRSWSGTPYNLTKALRSTVERLSVIDNLKVAKTLGHGVLRLVIGGKQTQYPLWRTQPALKGFASQLEFAVSEHQPDAVLSISSQPLIRFTGHVPTFITSDAPWATWSETYAPWQGKPWYTASFGAAEADAARRTRGLIFPTNWAAQEAARRYGMPLQNIGVVPYGASAVPPLGYDLTSSIKHRLQDTTLRLLFIGRDWERKGGPLTLEIADAIARTGQSVELHIVGFQPVIGENAAQVVIHDYLDMRDDDDRAKMLKLFDISHFLVTPTRAECYGLAFNEAQAYGLPPVSRAVGAVPEVIKNGVTGIVLSESASANDYAARVIEIWNTPKQYERMAKAGREAFENAANWDATAKGIVAFIASRI